RSRRDRGVGGEMQRLRGDDEPSRRQTDDGRHTGGSPEPNRRDAWVPRVRPPDGRDWRGIAIGRTCVTCRELADFLMAYLDGELDARVRRRFEDHLAGCAECVRALREYRATVRTGQLAYADDLPADIPEDLVKAILAGQGAKRG